ncbi:MAG: hypothetical protein J5938_02965, partial [Clostridia bacterium]|nr:hypothetical protein [Clostridia bacterium]
MKRFTTLLIAVLMLLSLLASCGEQPKEPPAFSEIPVSQSEEPGTEPASESVTEEAPATEEPLPSKYETEYAAPEDGSFTICGVPLSEYVPVLFFPTTEDYVKLNRKALLSGLKDPLSAATGSEWEFKVVKNDKYDTVKWAEHEILFGTNFHRDGMPETDLKKNYYGVTADGTVYFCSPSPMLYSYLWERFLEEFLGVEPGSGSTSGGCAVTECYRELPL